MNEDIKAMKDQINRINQEFREKVVVLEDVINNYKERNEMSNMIFSQTQHKFIEIEANCNKFKEKNEILKNKFDEQNYEKRIAIENYNNLKEKIKGLLIMIKVFYKETEGINLNSELFEKLKYLYSN